MSIHTASLGNLKQESAARRAFAPGLAVDAVRNWADTYRFWIFGAMFLMYIAGFSDKWQPEADSALYLSLGRSLALGHGYTDLGRPNHLVYPGLPWLIAGSFKTFGVDHLLPIYVMMLVFAAATLAMIYAIVCRRIDRSTAVVITAIVGLSDTFFRYAMKVLTDMPFMAGVMAVLLGCELVGWCRRQDDELAHPTRPLLGWTLIVVGLALATIMRPVIWALVFTIVAALILSAITRRGQWKYALGIVVVAVLMLACFFALDPRRAGGGAVLGNYEAGVIHSLRSGEMLRRMFHENFGLVFGPITTEALLGMRVGPGLNQLVAVIAIALALCLWKRHPLWALWVAVSLAMMLAMLPVRRYYLPILPFLVLGAWMGIVWLNRRISDRTIADILCIALLVLLAGPNMVRCANFSLQQHAIFVDAKGDKLGEEAMEADLARKLSHRLPHDAVILAPRRFSRVLGYLSGRHTLAAGSGIQPSDVHAPAFAVLPLQGEDRLMQADLQRLGLKPGRQVFAEKDFTEFQFAVYELQPR